MDSATLVIMAAGLGSRFGGGIKQLEPVGPNGELIIDYSIYDAMEAGFNKVVFVIRKDLEKDFREVIGDRIAKKIAVEYVFQELDDIPEAYREKFRERSKPWGTGQAVLCCKEVVREPFLVINADDYYGKSAYRKAFQELCRPRGTDRGKMRISMVGFSLENTLSENGGVTRGICRVDEQQMLHRIVETHNIVKWNGQAAVMRDGKLHIIDKDAIVSMNMWGLFPDFFPILEERFERFLHALRSSREREVRSEYLLPILIGELLEEDRIEVKVLPSEDRWFGVTYKEDKDSVVEAIRNLIENGEYK